MLCFLGANSLLDCRSSARSRTDYGSRAYEVGYRDIKYECRRFTVRFLTEQSAVLEGGVGFFPMGGS